MTGGILGPGQRGRRMVRQASHRQAFGRLRGIICMVGILGASMDGNKTDGHKMDGHKMDGHKMDGHRGLGNGKQMSLMKGHPHQVHR